MITFCLKIRRAGMTGVDIPAQWRGVTGEQGRQMLESIAQGINQRAGNARYRAGRYNKRTQGRRVTLRKGVAMAAWVDIENRVQAPMPNAYIGKQYKVTLPAFIVACVDGERGEVPRSAFLRSIIEDRYADLLPITEEDLPCDLTDL